MIFKDNFFKNNLYCLEIISTRSFVSITIISNEELHCNGIIKNKYFEIIIMNLHFL